MFVITIQCLNDDGQLFWAKIHSDSPQFSRGLWSPKEPKILVHMAEQCCCGIITFYEWTTQITSASIHKTRCFASKSTLHIYQWPYKL